MYNLRIVCAASLLAAWLAPSVVRAEDPPIGQLRTFYVNATSDAVDADVGDGICNSKTDPNVPPTCTLRAAVMQGNEMGEDWRVNIVLSPGKKYLLQIPGPAEQFSKTGDLDVRRPMDIGTPEGSEIKATVDANMLDRGFHFVGGGQSRLHGLKITNGLVTSGGAALHVEGAALEAERLEIAGNRRDDPAAPNEGTVWAGSAIRVISAELHLRDSWVRDNTGRYECQRL